MESKGFIKNTSKFTMMKSKMIVKTTLILSVLAVILVMFILITIFVSNKIMNRDGKTLSNVPSNILPSFEPCTFSSFDAQTDLSGWFFNCEDFSKGEPISTIIMVHNTGDNRLQFGVEMIDMVERMLDNHYNVFLFDLRNTGDSKGEISGYGYLEWQDVLGAISNVKKISVTTDVILYGVGTGCTASMLAYDKLPPANATDDELDNYSEDIKKLGFDQSYISGMIFDSPAKYSDDYIKKQVEQAEFLGFVTKYSVPYSIRVSSGVNGNINLAAEISRLPIPVGIIYGGHDSFVRADNIAQLVDERMRNNSNLTKSYVIPGAGYLEAYSTNHVSYIDGIMEYLTSYFALT